MKCPHCKKEIEEPIYVRDKVMDLWIPNCFSLLILLYVISRFLPVPINIEDGLSFNWDMFTLFIISIFYFIYIILYLHNKVKGRLLVYTYWINKET